MQSFNLTSDDIFNHFFNQSQSILPTAGAVDNISTTMSGMMDDTEAQMCELDDLKRSYHRVHGYLSLVVCIFGTIANILNIAVLTRKEMNGSPINRILTGDNMDQPHFKRDSFFS